MHRTIPLLDADPLIELAPLSILPPNYNKETELLNKDDGWTRAIEATVSGRIAQNVKAQQPIQLSDNMYLGNLMNVKNVNLLKNCKITHLLDCSNSRRLHDSLTFEELSDCARPVVAMKKPSMAQQALLLDLIDTKNTLGIQYIHLSDLSSSENNLPLKEVVNKMKSILKDQGATLFIFCLSGINRSATVCAAYLMKEERMTLIRSLRYLRDRCGPIIQLPGLQQHLFEYAIQIEQLGTPDEWPPEETDSDIENDLFADWRAGENYSLLGEDDADLSDDNFSQTAFDGTSNHCSIDLL